MRFPLLLAFIAMAAGPTMADEVFSSDTGQKLMLAAAVVLSDQSTHTGVLQIDDKNKAHFSNGSAFFNRMADCKYSQYYPEHAPFDWYEIIDFRALTGNYFVTQTFGVHSLVVEGDASQTRCFAFSGQKGCFSSLKLTVGPDEQRRAINNLTYIMDACPKEKPQPY